MKTKTVAGVDIGKTENDLAIVNADDFSLAKTVRLRGRWIYGKKCVRPEERTELIIQPDKDRYDNTFVLVLAKGEKCTDVIKINDIVSAPDDHFIGIMRSPYSEDDYMIDESILQLHIPQEAHND